MPADIHVVQETLWQAANQLRANSVLKASEYASPVLGLIFLRYADQRFAAVKERLEKQNPGVELEQMDYQAEGVMYLRETSRLSHLVTLKESDNLGDAINTAMEQIEADNPGLAGVLPKNYTIVENPVLVSLVKAFNNIPILEGDAFGKIYEYFLGKFAMSEGQKGGEFFTPTSIVKLIVEIIEPYKGRIYDPASGSGGMFVQSAQFVERHHHDPTAIFVCGQEKTRDTVKLGRMNLAIHGLSGDIREANSFYDDVHGCVGAFEYVMANPPFNVKGLDKERIKNDKSRYPLGMPSTDNANYIWVQLFHASLNDRGRAGFVMASSTGDARGSELDIRKKLIESGTVDVMVSVGPNFFYTVTLPCALWFFDKAKPTTARKGTILFLDARHIFQQIDRAHREWTDQQVEFLANIVRLYRGVPVETERCSSEMLKQHFPEGVYQDVAGLCKVATLADIEAQGWSLNPGRYVGVQVKAADEFVFAERLEELNEELEALNTEARVLEDQISENVTKLLEVL